MVWVLIALKLNDSLGRWVGQDNPLVLGSGTYQEEAVGGGLLYRQRLDGGWKGIQKQAGKGTELTVRKGLQLVIPHPEHVKDFLGEDFEMPCDRQERRGHRSKSLGLGSLRDQDLPKGEEGELKT